MQDWKSERAKLAVNTRHHGPTSEAALAARRNLRAARLEAYIRQVVDAAPPLTDEQRSRLALLLRGAA